MSAFKARNALCEMGLDKGDATTVLSFLQKHAHDDYTGGMHTNGGCHDGRCDYGCALCRAFTAMCAALAKGRVRS